MAPSKVKIAKADCIDDDNVLESEDDGLQMDLFADTTSKSVDVEVVLKDGSNLSRIRLVGRLDSFLKDGNVLTNLDMMEFGGTALEHDVDSVKVCLDTVENLGNKNLNYFIFKLNKDEPEEEDISETRGEEIVAASSTLLPSADLQGLWDSLIYETKVKENFSATSRLASF